MVLRSRKTKQKSIRGRNALADVHPVSSRRAFGIGAM